MIVGVPREIHRHEHRVGLNPFAVSRLVQHGHDVLLERGAGDAARFTDQHYQGAGGQTVYRAEEVYRRADLVCRVSVLSRDEIELLKPGSIVCGFQHLAVMPRENVQALMESRTTVVSYEMIRDARVRDARGELPVLAAFSEMAGQMAVQLASHYLQRELGGRGVLLGNIPGIPPPTVLILGAGEVGRAAARQAVACGAHAIVLDTDLAKLRILSRGVPGVVTAAAAQERLDHYVRIADVLIGAILVPGERPPLLVTEEMVRSMKAGSVIVDASIDQGGCVETSRPTTLDDPTFIKHDVVHYCVPNMTANVARTASRALVNVALPYVTALADRGLDEAIRQDAALAQGVVMYRGRIANFAIGRSLDMPVAPLTDLLTGRGAS
jgi:alanine dehydrogenase